MSERSERTKSTASEARALYDELTDDLLYDPAVGRSTMMGYMRAPGGSLLRLVRLEG